MAIIGKKTEWTEWDAQHALALLFRYRTNRVIPSCSTFGYEMDVCVITPSDYIYEIEIKRTLSDWKADEHKDKWKRERSEISKFYYAIPLELLDKKPAFVPDSAGIIILSPRTNENQVFRVYAHIHKEAARINKTKVDKKREYMMGVFYYRYWGLRWDMARTDRQPSQDSLDLGEPT